MHRPAPLVLAAIAAAVVGAAGLVFLLTRTESSADHAIQGDVNCDMAVGSVDALHVLRSVAELPTGAGCLDSAADTDCDGGIDAVDSLRILRYVVQLANSVVAGCPPIGDPLEDSLTPTPSPGGTLTESPTPTATATPALTSTPTPPTGGYSLSASGITTSWNDGLDFALVPGSPGEAAVVRQAGEVWKVFLDGSAPEIMGDISGRVASGGEEGLLSLAFSPDFDNDHRLYVHYTADNCAPGVTRCHHLSRFTVNGGVLDTGSEVIVLEIEITNDKVKNQSNHNGGSVRFGHDGMLYLSVGDGGGGGDPSETGQDNTDLLGSVLRLDVTGQAKYTVPADNPFAGAGDPGNDLVWAFGLRNPWRMSVDSLTGDIWLGDVGQGSREEIDQIVAARNYGWDCYEGFDSYETDGCSANPMDYERPRADYGHGGGNLAVTGGYVYHGNTMPELDGWYVYADAYSGRIWAVKTSDSTDPVELLDTDKFIYSFAELDTAGGHELLVLTADGIYRLAHA